MRCQDLDPVLAPYVDNEAAAHERAAVDAHLAACPPCRDRVTGERAARLVVQGRRDTLRCCASEALRTRCARLTAGTRAERRGAAILTRRWVPLSLAATLVLAVAGVFLISLSDRVEVFAAQLALDHVKCFKFTPDRIAKGDATVIGRDWEAARGWALKVPSTAREYDLELMGVRRCGSTSGSVAHVLYRWRGEPLSVYVLPGPLAPPPAVQSVVDTLGHEAIVWSHAGRTYAVVARGSRDELARVASYVKINAY
jgi:anti-sigma factor RsiW